MKVVLFCGGFGMRLRDYSEAIPKPMVQIGYRPILWHVMKYYAHHGHRDFILCLGWKANIIKDYFLNYNECLSNDFKLSQGGRAIELLHRDIEDWNISFVDTGLSSNIAERLQRIQPHVQDEDHFLANYTDGLSDVCLHSLVDFHIEQKSIATFVGVRPSHSFHTVRCDSGGKVNELKEIRHADVWMNGGFFVFQNSIFDYLRNGHELVNQPFQELIAQDQLSCFKHDGFWSCMDTYKEMQSLHEMHDRGDTPWALWENNPRNGGFENELKFEPAPKQESHAALKSK